jgi:hypothetical protein
VTEKFYRAKADALLLQEIILPKTKKPAVIFSGSHDLALEGIAEHLEKHITLLSMPVGSLDGLVNLRPGTVPDQRFASFGCDMGSTTHLSSVTSSLTVTWKLSRWRIAHRG